MSAVTRSLKTLEGSKEVRLKDFGTGHLEVTFSGKSIVSPARVRKSLGTYELRRIDLSLTGDVKREGDGLVLLFHETPLNLEGGKAVEEWLRKDKSHLKVSGTLTERKVKVEGGKEKVKLFLKVSDAKPAEEKKGKKDP